MLLEGQRGAARQRLDLAFEQADDVDQRLGLGSGVAARGEEGEVGGFVGMLGEAPQEFDEGRADQRGLAAADAAAVAVDAQVHAVAGRGDHVDQQGEVGFFPDAEVAQLPQRFEDMQVDVVEGAAQFVADDLLDGAERIAAMGVSVALLAEQRIGL